MIPKQKKRPGNHDRSPGPDGRLVLKILEEAGERSQGVTVGALYQEFASRLRADVNHAGLVKDLEAAGLVRVQGRSNSSDRLLTLLPEGRRRLRELESSVPLSQRVPVGMLSDLQDLARQELFPRSQLVAQLLEESVRTRLFPEIEFRGKACDRKPYVAGTRLSPWFVRLMFEQHHRDVERARQTYPDLTPNQIRQADSYARRYAHEAPPTTAPPEWLERVDADL